MTIAEQMTDELKAETAMTRKLLAKIPDDKLAFTPGSGLHTIGWNANHLADIVGWVGGIVHEDGMDLADPAQQFNPAEATELRPVLEKLDANLAKSIEQLKGVSDEKLAETWTMSMNKQPLFAMKKRDCVRKWVFGHLAHHRGAMSVTLRLAGVSFESIYEG